MKYYIIGLVFFSTLISPLVLAKNNQLLKKEVKCHVELYGGKETIYFGLAPLNELKNYAQSIIGKKIYVAKTKKKKSIYKVLECVAMNDKFTSRKAKALDNDIPK